LTVEGIETLDTTAHEGTEQDVGMVVKGPAQHSGQGQDGVPIDDALMKLVTDLGDEVIDVDFGASQTQSGFTAHGNDVAALSTVEASIFGISDLFGVTTAEHLFHEFIIVGAIIARIVSLKALPVILEDLFEDTPPWNCICFHKIGYRSCSITYLLINTMINADV
jgi:hypothetical protein